MSMDVREQEMTAARALMAKVLAEEVASEVKRTRDALEPTIRPGGRVVGVLPDGTEVGAVVRGKRPVSAVVTDEAALLAYVERARPDEVVTTKSIRSTFRTWLLDEAKRQLTDPEGLGEFVDKDGEIVPGIELAEGTPSYRPDVSPAGRARLRKVLAELLGAELAEALALTAGEEPTP
jgi:hypothetical protein